MPINLSYPLNVEGDDQQGHYIMFIINEVTQGKVDVGADGPNPAELTIDTSLTGFQGKKFIDEHLNKGAGKSNETFRRAAKGSGLHMDRPGTTRMTQAITLYMPPSVKVSYKSNYANPTISGRAGLAKTIGGGLIDSMSEGGDFSSIEAWQKAGEAFSKSISSITESGTLLAADAAIATASIAAPGAVALAQISAGEILGSKMEVMFEGVGRRSFSFSFNFIPKSEQESQMVHKIVQTFKEHMLPEYRTFINLGEHLGGTYKIGSGRVLKIPNTFDIFYFFHNNENPFLNRISTCYLTSLDIDYGGDKYVTYEPTKLNDGQEGPPPQRTAISLAFTEIETITRERAKDGF